MEVSLYESQNLKIWIRSLKAWWGLRCSFFYIASDKERLISIEYTGSPDHNIIFTTLLGGIRTCYEFGPSKPQPTRYPDAVEKIGEFSVYEILRGAEMLIEEPVFAHLLELKRSPDYCGPWSLRLKSK